MSGCVCVCVCVAEKSIGFKRWLQLVVADWHWEMAPNANKSFWILPTSGNVLTRFVDWGWNVYWLVVSELILFVLCGISSPLLVALSNNVVRFSNSHGFIQIFNKSEHHLEQKWLTTVFVCLSIRLSFSLALCLCVCVCVCVYQYVCLSVSDIIKAWHPEYRNCIYP